MRVQGSSIICGACFSVLPAAATCCCCCCHLLLLLLLLVGMYIGYRPYPADGYPVLGWAGDSSNVYVAGEASSLTSSDRNVQQQQQQEQQQQQCVCVR
jgi:hypothetical protein